MIYDVAKIVAEELAARDCPLRVIYGPERLSDVSLTDSRIVIERVRGRSDSYVAPRSGRNNPPRRADCLVAGTATIYARSGVAGARIEEHEAIADQAADLVYVALKTAANQLLTTVEVISAGLLSAADLGLDDLESWPAVVYEIGFSFRRGVNDLIWDTDSRPVQTEFTVETIGVCIVADGNS